MSPDLDTTSRAAHQRLKFSRARCERPKRLLHLSFTAPPSLWLCIDFGVGHASPSFSTSFQGPRCSSRAVKVVTEKWKMTRVYMDDDEWIESKAIA